MIVAFFSSVQAWTGKTPTKTVVWTGSGFGKSASAENHPRFDSAFMWKGLKTITKTFTIFIENTLIWQRCPEWWHLTAKTKAFQNAHVTSQVQITVPVSHGFCISSFQWAWVNVAKMATWMQNWFQIALPLTRHNIKIHLPALWSTRSCLVCRCTLTTGSKLRLETKEGNSIN